MRSATTRRCPGCRALVPTVRLNEVRRLAPQALAWLLDHHPTWDPLVGACPDCLRNWLDELYRDRMTLPPREWPGPGREPAWDCLPTAHRLGLDRRFTGAGVTIAFVDAAFAPHPDLCRPHNRVQAWADVTRPRAKQLFFSRDKTPRWPGWDAGKIGNWHGLMASGIACGNGNLSHGLYAGPAPAAQTVLIHTLDKNRRITNDTLARAARWILKHADALNIRVVNFSVAGDPVTPLAGNAVDTACEEMVSRGIVVTAAAGNSGANHLVPPATADSVITMGGVDDRDRADPKVWRLWHSNYGRTAAGHPKPELVAQSWRVVAPMVPNTSVTAEAKELFARRAAGDRSAEERIDAEKMVSPHYQHMDGTSVAAPVAAGVVACMIQANPALTPQRVREILRETVLPLAGAPKTRQGAGVLQAAAAIDAAESERPSGVVPLGRRL